MTTRKSMQNLQNRIRAWRDTAHLYEQPDHILRDIGIHRSEIISVVRFGDPDASRRLRE